MTLCIFFYIYFKKMCGITGILKFDNRKIDKNELLKFTKSLNHRGPDNIDFYINKNENLGFIYWLL